MLFRFHIIVSLLLASVAGAPINICRHDPWTKHTFRAGIGTRVVSRTRVCIIGQDNCFLHTEQCKGPKDWGLDGILPPMIPWNKVITYIVVFTIIILPLGTFIGVICNTIRRHRMKDKSRRNDKDKETRDKPIVDGILPPMIPWKNVITYIVAFTIITIVPEILIDAICDIICDTICDAICRHLMKDKPMRDAASQCSTYEDKETHDKPIGKHENKQIIGNGEAARGPMAEKNDSLNNTEIKKQSVRDIIAKFEARQKVIIDSDS